MDEKNNNPALRQSINPFSKGFTLLEVMLVVVLILIATTIAIPKLAGSFGSTRMKDAVRSTVRATRFARSMSILKQKDCKLSFADNRIQLTCGDEVLAKRNYPETVTVSGFENLSGEGSEDKIAYYYANGMNDGFELTLTDNNSRQHTVTCHPITGKVSLDD